MAIEIQGFVAAFLEPSTPGGDVLCAIGNVENIKILKKVYLHSLYISGLNSDGMMPIRFGYFNQDLMAAKDQFKIRAIPFYPGTAETQKFRFRAGAIIKDAKSFLNMTGTYGLGAYNGNFNMAMLDIRVEEPKAFFFVHFPEVQRHVDIWAAATIVLA